MFSTTKIVTNLFITPVTKTINSKTKDTSVNNEFIYFMYSFVPCYNYYNIANDTLWDNQLFVFKNIVQSKNIKIRYDIKEINKMKIKECKNNYGNDEEKIDIIMEDYRNTIERLKNDTIFKLVNYLNWNYYNNKCKNTLVWQTILCRLTNYDEHNNISPFYNEMIPHNKQLYAYMII